MGQQDEAALNHQQDKDEVPDSDKKDEKILLEELRLKGEELRLKEESRLKELSEKYSFWKFVLGSVAVAIITAFLNFQIKDQQLNLENVRKAQEIEILAKQKESELQLAKAKNEGEFLAKFIEQALDINLEARIRFSHYFSSLVDPEGQKNRWEEYHTTLLATATNEAKKKEAATAVIATVAAQRATATTKAEVTGIYVAEQLSENPTEFAPIATQIAIGFK